MSRSCSISPVLDVIALLVISLALTVSVAGPANAAGVASGSLPYAESSDQHFDPKVPARLPVLDERGSLLRFHGRPFTGDPHSQVFTVRVAEVGQAGMRVLFV